jgi:hypothetical protein
VAFQLVEELGVSDALKGNGVYQLTMLQAMRLTTSLGRFFGVEVLEALGITDDILAGAMLLAQLEDSVALEAVVQPLLVLNVMVEDDVLLEPHHALQTLFSATVREGVHIEAGYIAPDGSFTTWAMNTRTGSVTEYRDFVFNSFAQVGNKYLGASSTGLYELLGDDDNGEDIIARIKGGFMQFGSTHLSRLKGAYLAGRGTGEMFLKIIEGDDREYVYKAEMINMRSSKVHMGKGQRSRYFAFELVSTGQDFDLDTLEFVPIVVQRRV